MRGRHQLRVPKGLYNPKHLRLTMPRLAELKQVEVTMRYRKRAMRLMRKLSAAVEELKHTPTGSELIALASNYTHFDCVFYIALISAVSSIYRRISVVLFSANTWTSLYAENPQRTNTGTLWII